MTTMKISVNRAIPRAALDINGSTSVVLFDGDTLTVQLPDGQRIEIVACRTSEIKVYADYVKNQ